MEKLRVLSLFSGVGAPEMALRNLDIDYELVGFSEIDKWAIKSYCEIHGVNENLNLGDITKIEIDKLPNDIDLITHGSPCQDFSVAGHGKGGELGSGTRSSLMWNTVSICEYCKPKYVLWENVKNVLSKKHKHNFDKYLDEMDRLGYNNYYRVLNAKNYGIPQNRERVFVISIRKDISKQFKFPIGFDNDIKLKDILENNVEESYYLSSEQIKKILHWKAYQRPLQKVLRTSSICPTLTARGAGEYHSGMILIHEKEETINYEEILYVKTNTKRGYDIAQEGDCIRLDHLESKTGRGRVQKGISSTLTCSCQVGVVENA